KSCLPSSVPLVNQIWLPQMTGDDQPRSWIGTFQTTFSFSPHLIGKPIALDWPSPVGPRKRGQLSSATAAAARRAERKRAIVVGRRMAVLAEGRISGRVRLQCKDPDRGRKTSPQFS